MNPVSLSFRRPAQGFTLVELIMTLGIGLLIAAGVWTVYGERQAIARGTAGGFTVQALLDQADSAYALNIEFATGGFAGDPNPKQPLSIDRLAAALSGDLPAGVEQNGTTYDNRWGGQWSMGADSSDGGNTLDLVVVQTTGVPGAECKVMLTQLAPLVYDTRVNGQLVGLSAAEGTTNVRSTVNYGQAMPLCLTTNNTMVFRRLKELDLSSLRRVKPYTGTLTAEERGEAPSRRYRQAFLPNYNRIQAALAARETAQQGLSAGP